MLKIYLIGIIIYTIGIFMAKKYLFESLEKEYEESEAFKDKVDEFVETTSSESYKKLREGNIVRLALMGLCPILHWIAAAIYIWVAVFPDSADRIVRETIDKIIN